MKLRNVRSVTKWGAEWSINRMESAICTSRTIPNRWVFQLIVSILKIYWQYIDNMLTVYWQYIHNKSTVQIDSILTIYCQYIDNVLTMYWQCIDIILTIIWHYIDSILTTMLNVKNVLRFLAVSCGMCCGGVVMCSIGVFPYFSMKVYN